MDSVFELAKSDYKIKDCNRKNSFPTKLYFWNVFFLVITNSTSDLYSSRFPPNQMEKSKNNSSSFVYLSFACFTLTFLSLLYQDQVKVKKEKNISILEF